MAGSRRFKWWIPWIGIVLVLIIGAAGVFLWKRPVAFELDDVESATVRNGNNGDEVILTQEDLQVLLDHLKSNRLIKQATFGSSGGWSFMVDLYGNGEQLHRIVVISDDAVEYDGHRYQCVPGLDREFLSALFTRNAISDKNK